MTRTCPNCAELNGPNAERCRACSYKLVLFLTKPVAVNLRNCRHCGRSLYGRPLQTRYCSNAHKHKHYQSLQPRALRPRALRA